MAIITCSNCDEEIDTDWEGITCESCQAELCLDCQEDECPLCGESINEYGRKAGRTNTHYYLSKINKRFFFTKEGDEVLYRYAKVLSYNSIMF